MRRYRIVLILTLVLLEMPSVSAQVPIDLSQAREFRVILTADVGRGPGPPHLVESPCENPGRDILSVPSTGGGRSFFTRPRIDTTLPQPEGFKSTYMLIDYDGKPPIEYMNQNGRVDACVAGEYPFEKTPLDTIQCWATYISMEASVDVDGDGAIDVVCNTGGNDATAWIVLGGASAGKGCERILKVPKVKAANKMNLTRAFYKSATGEWRLIQEERDSVDRAPRLQMYRVNFTRSTSKPEVSFTALGVFRGEDVSQEDEPFGELAVIVDSVNGVDHMLMDHRIGPPGSLWALERFTITSGEIDRSGEIIDGYNFYEGTHWDLQYSLGTDKPIVLISSDRGGLFSYVDDLTRPIALFDPTDTGAQPVIGLAVVNDQTGDQQPDMVFVGGDGVLLVVSLDTAMTSIGVDPTTNDDPRLSLSGSSLTVVSNSNEDVTIEIASVDGRIVTRVMTYSIVAGKNYIDLERTLGSLSTGAYFIRVKSGQLIRVLAIVR